MPHQTPDQAAKRINKAIDKKYPLVGEHFHTTPDEQAARYKCIDEGERQRRINMEQFECECYERAANHLYMLIEHIGEEQVNAIARQREQFESHWQATTTGAYTSDFWFNQLRKYTQFY